MGNCFSGCTKGDDSASSSGREKNAKTKGRFKRKRRNNTKASRKNSPSSAPKDKLSVTSVDSSNDAGTVGAKNECLSGIEAGASNARMIIVQPSVESENSSKETFPGEGIKRPFTGSESNASLSPSSSSVEPTYNDDLEELGHDEESSATLPTAQASVEPENPERRSHLQLLQFLRIRLDMAVNNLEINRLLANVDRSLDRSSRIRELGFRRMRVAAEESRRASQDQEETGTASSDGEETYDEDDEEDEDSDGGGDTPPPPVPRICWQ